MPSSGSERVMPEINAAICTLCGRCVAECPQGAASLVGGRVVLDEERCVYCGDCEGLCPVGAIALPYDIVLDETQRTEARDGTTGDRQDR